MDLKNLVAKGYFAEELPPPFQTLLLAKNAVTLLAFQKKISKIEKDKIKETICTLYSTPKIGIYRRNIGIPNPIHQLPLSEIISKAWPTLKLHWNTSKISASVPTIDKRDSRAVSQIAKFSDFKEKCIKISFDKLYELKADVSKYFPSIYTHSIPWALHTKKIAKANKYSKSLLGNIIDEAIRFGQSGQTKGIPIGTDTSRIVAEIIGCAIDVELKSILIKDNIHLIGYRFIDDYQLYFNTRSDADKALKILQKILTHYSLDLNEEKTLINHAPYSIDNDWSYQLNSCPLRSSDIPIQKYDIITYANLVINISLQQPNEYIIKYGIKRLLKLKVFKDNWELYESLILKLGISEPSTLPSVCSFLLQNEASLSKIKLKSFINSILEQSIYKGHNFEISWALWIAKTFTIKIELDHAQNIIDSKDVISILVLLDLNNSNLIVNRTRLNLKDLKSEFTEDGLVSELWLLVYEASLKKWIKSSVLKTVDYFTEMERLKISFYDPNRQIDFDESNIKSEIDKDDLDEFISRLEKSKKIKSKIKRNRKAKTTY